LTSAFFGSVRIFFSAGSSRSSKRGDHRQTADEFGNQAELQQIVRLDLAEDLAGAAVVGGPSTLAPKPIDVPLPRAEMIFSRPGKGAAADEQDVGRVDLQELLLRMLAPALRRHGRDRAFHDLQQGLLHALARHVARDRGIVGLAADLVDFVDIDDAALRPLDIVVGGLQQLQDDVLDVLADITGFGQRGGVGHGEGHVENARQRLGQQRLARTRRADQQDVGLRQFDVVVLGGVVEALVVVVHRDREHLLGVILADHIIVEDLADLLAVSARRRAT
jgi:hypothetical protein